MRKRERGGSLSDARMQQLKASCSCVYYTHLHKELCQQIKNNLTLVFSLTRIQVA